MSTDAVSTDAPTGTSEGRASIMKKLINDPAGVVADALVGIEAAHRELRVDHEHRVIYRADAPVAGKVGLISGGGSGHEPMHGGFVGPGMLDAACPGEVFTSPTPDQMLEATRRVDGGAGVVHIVKNYTGDVMNFEMAAEMAADATGIKVESVVTNDDVAVQDSLYTAGRRGVGVTVLVEKLCGAAADAGHDLAGVAAIGRKANAWGRSMGLALTSCTVPAAGKPTFSLSDSEVEIGIGIHGEPGRYREAVGSAAAMAERLAAPILEDLPFRPGDAVLAFVNGMGGTPLIELYVMFGELRRILDGHGITIARSLVGPFMTSLEMAGCSITLLKLDDGLVRLWDAPVKTPALRWGG
jgi:phosphoenolpyruvate---glycerone phosphotransferase subunit DhaK